MNESEIVRKLLSRYKISSDRATRSKDYDHILYFNDTAVLKTKSLEDAQVCRDALIERDVKLLRAEKSNGTDRDPC